MIDVLIFSKDRACQLDLCLRTIKKKLLIDKQIRVQYTVSTTFHQEGFDKIIKQYPSVEFIKENNFIDTTKNIIKTFKNDHCIFFTDDDVFINEVNNENLGELVSESNRLKNIHCISFRMNPTINHCYPAHADISPPSTFLEREKYLMWNWSSRSLNQHCCWGYPMAINGHLYETNLIRPVILNQNFYNVNSLESCINRNRFKGKPLIISFTETKVYNVQNNFVQGKKINEVVDIYSVDKLNALYLEGKSIREDFYGMNTTMAHGKLKYCIK